jgi:hypothetical protein
MAMEDYARELSITYAGDGDETLKRLKETAESYQKENQQLKAQIKVFESQKKGNTEDPDLQK